MFKVTRGLILNVSEIRRERNGVFSLFGLLQVAGAIVTYELVLIQFNNSSLQ